MVGTATTTANDSKRNGSFRRWSVTALPARVRPGKTAICPPPSERTGSPVVLAGAPVRAGVLNRHPSLDDLGLGDLKMQVDFREVYAALLSRWLNVDSSAILGGSFAPFDCLRTK